MIGAMGNKIVKMPFDGAVVACLASSASDDEVEGMATDYF